MTAFLTPAPEVAALGLRAMKQVATSDGALRPGARRVLDAAQKLLLGTQLDLAALAPITPAELAEAFPPVAELREQFVRGMVVVSLTDGKPRESTSDSVRAFARALAVHEPALDALHRFATGHMLLGALDYHRRSNIRDMLAGELEKRGLFGAVKSVLGLRGFLEDPAIAAPYLALETLPPGTLGRAFFDHYRQNHFAFPGEKGGFPEAGVYHDLTHVLAGFGTDPLGEIQVGAFTAGFREKNAVFVAMLPLLVFSADINVTPIPHDHVDAIFSQPGTAERFIQAYRRGTQVTRDLSDHWDFWPELARPLEAVRKELRIA